MNKLAIIYICLGAYKVFWDEFYESAEQNFAQDMERTYFVFTDADNLIRAKIPKAEMFYTTRGGWPYDTMLRWDNICRIQDRLSDYDEICFCNANTKFLRQFNPGPILAGADLELYSAVAYGTPSSQMPLERNMKSRAGIPEGDNITHYYSGAYILGTADAMLTMSRILRDWTEEDLRNGLIPCWHDESLLNSYVYRHPELKIAIVDRKTILAEEFTDKENPPAVILRNKDHYGGNFGLRTNNIALGKIEIVCRKATGKMRFIKCANHD